MKVCKNAKQLRSSLKNIQPSKIAVAFVGAGWEKYISIENLEEIILSPTIGSNPKAIEEIMDTLGERNVYFLDNLHSKIYLGAKSALVGSSNLSDNGFSDSGLFETGIVLSVSNDLKKLHEMFDDYKNRATCDYPTGEDKKKNFKN